MKPENRVFFSSEDEAIAMGYRCCKNCWRPQKNKPGRNTGEL
ncbi:hypothetical protein LZZ85_01380 [Terrimonas sp. NA20]|uniref:Ada DNA repair metal-binding domain-containing protein n=2 Tax=Terrimonas ginsenosidimutans TaxID=2908004 RepID=A0ABS9KKQ6_9BACT|nr:hypothetical protein [Terrimonas ginsenosidimutans]